MAVDIEITTPSSGKALMRSVAGTYDLNREKARDQNPPPPPPLPVFTVRVLDKDGTILDECAPVTPQADQMDPMKGTWSAPVPPGLPTGVNDLIVTAALTHNNDLDVDVVTGISN